MAAKEDLHRKLTRWRGEAARIGQNGISAPVVQLWARVGIHFLLGAVLAGAVILDGAAPFGVSLVAAAGDGLCGGMALLGAGLGYMTLLSFSDGLRYFSAATLTFAVGFAFYDLKVMRRPWSMPLAAGAINAVTGFIYLSQGGWRTQELVLFALEILLTVGAAWCFRQLLIPIRQDRELREATDEQRVSTLALICCCMASVSGLELGGGISLGRAASAMLVLAAAWKGGPAPGAILGVSLGLTMDLAGGDPPLYAMSWGIAALAAGMGRKRLLSALAFVAVHAAAVAWTWGQGLRTAALYEVFVASVVFVALPERLWAPLGPLVIRTEPERLEDRNLKLARRRLEATAGAFRGVYESLRGAFQVPDNDNDVAMVFDRAASQVCRHCSLSQSCWDREYMSTLNALNDATAAMLERGRGLPEDFPHHFSQRCLRFPAFLEAVNRELTALLYRRQYRSRIRESRLAVCRQYGQMARLLDRAAAELGQELTADPPAQRRLRMYLAGLGLEPETAVYRDEYGRLRAEIRGEGSDKLTGKLSGLSQALGVPLRREEGEDGLVLIQLEPLMAVAGVAARKRDGETVSGDAGTYFKREDGTLYVLLCDGMGSGPEASRESNLALRLLERFIQAGVETEQALMTLSSALALRGEEQGGFTTIDLLQVDLFTGEGAVYKLGAAPTYLKRGGAVRKITGGSLPAGLGTRESAKPDCAKFRLEPGDCVLMVSDGVAGTGEDDWVRRRLQDFSGESPKELSRSLITDNPEGVTDDRTALAVMIRRRTG